MCKILLIGAGQIGSRHLQSLAKINLPVELFIVDSNDDSLILAKERYEQIPFNPLIKKISFFRNYMELNQEFDIAIIATSSDIRRHVFEDSLKYNKFSNVIFEKVLFQKISDYLDVEEILNKNNIKAWVNCPNRIMKIYNDIKKIFSSDERITYHIMGGNWGLACNSIHYLDYLSYLTGDYNFDFDTTYFDNEYYESKRKNFIEFSGTLNGSLSNGSKISFFSEKNSNSNLLQIIMSKNAQVIIDETKLKIRISKKDDNWKWIEKDFNFDFQSNLTHKIAEDIFQSGECGLTKYLDSIKIHLPFIKELIFHLNKNNINNFDYCPIT